MKVKMGGDRLLHNNKGMSTLVIVFGISMVIMVFLGTAQMYVNSRARAKSAIRLATKYTFVMEDLAKLVVNARLTYLSAMAAGAGCPAGTIAREIPQAGIAPGAAERILLCLNNAAAIAPAAAARCVVDSQLGAACLCIEGQNDPQCADPTIGAFEVGSEDIVAKGSLFDSFSESLNSVRFRLEDTVASNIDFVLKIPTPKADGLFRTAFTETAKAAVVDVTVRAIPLPAGNTAPTTLAQQADTFFSCAQVAGRDTCVLLRVCTREAVLAGANGQFCMSQMITRGDGTAPF